MGMLVPYLLHLRLSRAGLGIIEGEVGRNISPFPIVHSFPFCSFS